MTDRLPMVGWYDPLQLARTGLDVASSIAFGRFADYRLIEALATEEQQIHDYSSAASITIDYVADTGDGWDSTYAVGQAVSRPSLTLSSGEMLPRGSILIFGGDEIYPVASRLAYEQRLIGPYAAACATDSGDVFAIPGNHDWYDGLVAFTRLFCGRDQFACWKTPQSRSYFALKLPRAWWLLGTDVQLGSDIDVPQLNYFNWVAAQMAPNDQVILCNAEPYWTIREKYGRMRPELLHSNLEVLINTTFARQRVRVLLAGDSHHYQRHVRPDDGQQRIIAGGGGAFLHLTNGPVLDTLGGGREGVLQTTWPTREESNRLCLRNLAFPILNPHFGDVTGLVYLLIAWTLGTSLLLSQLLESGGPLFRNATGLGPAFFWGLLVVLTFILFTDTHSKNFRVTAGILHGLAHYLALLLLIRLGAFVARSVIPERWYGRITWRFLVFSCVVFAGAWLAGGLLMGLYLWISLRWLGHHQNEASSSLRIPDWKNFLRMIIDPSGKLTIYAIGIRRVPRQWTNDHQPASADPRATQPELLEKIVV